MTYKEGEYYKLGGSLWFCYKVTKTTAYLSRESWVRSHIAIDLI